MSAVRPTTHARAAAAWGSAHLVRRGHVEHLFEELHQANAHVRARSRYAAEATRCRRPSAGSPDRAAPSMLWRASALVLKRACASQSVRAAACAARGGSVSQGRAMALTNSGGTIILSTWKPCVCSGSGSGSGTLRAVPPAHRGVPILWSTHPYCCPYHTTPQLRALWPVGLGLALASSVSATDPSRVYCAQHGRPQVYCGTTGSVTV